MLSTIKTEGQEVPTLGGGGLASWEGRGKWKSEKGRMRRGRGSDQVVVTKRVGKKGRGFETMGGRKEGARCREKGAARLLSNLGE